LLGPDLSVVGPTVSPSTKASRDSQQQTGDAGQRRACIRKTCASKIGAMLAVSRLGGSFYGCLPRVPSHEAD
jgi:hypothetical protein